MSPLQQQFFSTVKVALERERAVVEQQGLTTAAVLVPIVFRDDLPNLVLTQRTMSVASHKGQISFPGGVTEPTDTSAVHTALREAEEEIGLSPSLVDPVGLLDDFTTVTGFRVTPVVGLVDPDASFTAHPDEVAELFELPVREFDDPEVHELVTVELDGHPRQYHSYEIGERIIWGATAGIIYRFLEQLAASQEEISPPLAIQKANG